MMKNILKQAAAILLAIVLVVGVAPIGALPQGRLSEKAVCGLSLRASAATYSGKCGANVNWTLNTSTGVLSVTGTGATAEYTYDMEKPWDPHSSSIKKITIGSGVTGIGSHIFQDCANLTAVTIPAGVAEIGEFAFSGCTSLSAVTIPESVTRIGAGAFYDCTSLAAITVDENNPEYCSDNSGVLYNKDKTVLVQYPVGNARTSFTIPAGVTSIGDMAFYDCASLTSVTIPAGVTSIGDHAFHECSNLAAVTLGTGVKRIGDMAFYDCAALAAVTIPDSVTEICRFAFCNCTSLASVTLGSGVKNIGQCAFFGCTSLNSVDYRGSEQDRQKISIGSRNDQLVKAKWHYSESGSRIIRGNPADGHKEYGYRATVTFAVEVPEGGSVQWYVDGQPAGNDATLTVKNKKSSYTVSVVVTSSDGSQTTDEERVTIKTDFWSKIVWFFTHLLFPGRYRIEQ